MNADTFASLLLEWSRCHQRTLPWKKNKNPYNIWISEIILQQTRLEQGIPYYLSFIEMFPTVELLAAADEKLVLKQWEGLGYYSRARNLHASAKSIVHDKNGVFPTEYSEILALKGIGPYTAAAIASFAFDQKHAVVDGNVIRLISRILALADPIEQKSTKESIKSFVTKGIQNTDPAAYNQALMDFGATICTPFQPLCSQCPFIFYCKAKAFNLIDIIPLKAKKIIKRQRYFLFFDIQIDKQFTVVNQRLDNDIWKGLFQFPMVELDSDNENFSLIQIEEYLKNILGDNIKIESVHKVETNKQILTHQIIQSSFYKTKVICGDVKINKDQYLVERTKVTNFAFPKIIADYLKNSNIIQ